MYSVILLQLTQFYLQLWLLFKLLLLLMSKEGKSLKIGDREIFTLIVKKVLLTLTSFNHVNSIKLDNEILAFI